MQFEGAVRDAAGVDQKTAKTIGMDSDGNVWVRLNVGGAAVSSTAGLPVVDQTLSIVATGQTELSTTEAVIATGQTGAGYLTIVNESSVTARLGKTGVGATDLALLAGTSITLPLTDVTTLYGYAASSNKVSWILLR